MAKRRQDQEHSSKHPRWDDSVFGLAQQLSTSRVHDLCPEPCRDCTEPCHDGEIDDSNETLLRRPRRSFFREEKFTEAVSNCGFLFYSRAYHGAFVQKKVD